jgi:saccharopine dehydrogenase-like NADP-dependent oxidoreductase
MYKFSWSPRGVLRACQNDARYREDGEIVEVSFRRRRLIEVDV